VNRELYKACLRQKEQRRPKRPSKLHATLAVPRSGGTGRAEGETERSSAEQRRSRHMMIRRRGLVWEDSIVGLARCFVPLLLLFCRVSNHVHSYWYKKKKLAYGSLIWR
jgi:hypothetical protein